LLKTNYRYDIREFLDIVSKWLTFSNNYDIIN
jgi:hypothetical protein